MTNMRDWLKTPLGEYIHFWEEEHFQSLAADIFGYNAVQVGFPEIHALKENRISNRWVTLPFTPDPSLSPEEAENPARGSYPGQIAVVHGADELPFATSSVDLAVLPHTLDFSPKPHQMLREVSRILIPEGKVLISGFNPASLFGFRQKFGRYTGSHFLPEYAEFLSLSRLKDWLYLLNFETSFGRFGCYRPPCESEGRLNGFSFMEKAGDRWWPSFGAVYMICAVKRVKGMTLVGKAFSEDVSTFLQPASVNQKAASLKNETENGE